MMVLQSLADGILIGGVYAAIGIGLSLAYGVMGVVNWSHGETLMMSMYLALFLTKYAGFDPYATIIVTAVVMAAYGYILQRFIFNNILEKTSKPTINILLFTAGLGLTISSLANMIFGGEAYTALTRYTNKSIKIHFGDELLLISTPKLISFCIAILATFGLYVFIQRTETGRAIRATSQDRSTAQLMGVNSNKVFCIAFSISLALVGIAGSLLIPFYPVYPYVGSVFSFKSFIIVALGGKGNIPGALIGGLTIGIIEKIGGYFVSDNMAQIIIFILFIAILLFKPDGLLSGWKKAK